MDNRIINVEARTADIIAIEIITTVKNTQKIMLEAAISIGNGLIEAKELVGHGEWEKWLEEKVDFSQSKANKYMKIAREYGQISKTDTCTNLSYSNALRLLAVPEEEREDFVKNNDVENMTVKQLEEEIKKIKDEKGSSDKQLEEALEEKEMVLQANAMLIDEKNELEEKVEELKEAAAGNNDEEVQKKIEEALEEKVKLLSDKEKQLEKEQVKADKLQKKIEKLEAEKDAEIEKVKADAAIVAKEEAEKESQDSLNQLNEEVRIANEKLALAEKQIKLSSNQHIVEFKIYVDKLQGTFNDILSTITSIETNDVEQAGKCKNALKVVLESLEGRCV